MVEVALTLNDVDGVTVGDLIANSPTVESPLTWTFTAGAADDRLHMWSGDPGATGTIVITALAAPPRGVAVAGHQTVRVSPEGEGRP